MVSILQEAADVETPEGVWLDIVLYPGDCFVEVRNGPNTVCRVGSAAYIGFVTPSEMLLLFHLVVFVARFDGIVAVKMLGRWRRL